MKKYLALLLVLVLVVSMTACANNNGLNADKVGNGNGNPVEKNGDATNDNLTIDEMINNLDEDITVGISLFNYSNNWCSWQRNAMLNWFDQCENDHIKYFISDAQNDQAKQNEAVDTMIARGIDVLICYVVQSTGASAIAEKCEQAGIPVVFLNTKVDAASLDDYDRTWFIGANNESKAHLQMDIIFDLLGDKTSFADIDKNGDGKINMFYIQGPVNEDMAICFQTVKDRIAESEYKDVINLLEQQNSDNSTANCKEIAETWVGKYDKDIELCLCHTDAQAAGAIAAFQAADLLSEDNGVYVIASNCLPDAQVHIRDGIQYSSVLTDPWWQATNCIKMALSAAMGNDLKYGNLLHGFDEEVQFSEKHPKIVYIVLTGITKDNVDIATEAYNKSTRTE